MHNCCGKIFVIGLLYCILGVNIFFYPIFAVLKTNNCTMQIIQNIRDKGAAIVIVVIALSLIGFILMDAQQGGSKLFSSLSSNIGSVNGDKIEFGEFNKRVRLAEEMQQRGGPGQTYQVREQTWNQLVAERIFFAETKKLGIEFTPDEFREILLSNDPSNPLLKEPGMTDSATGKLDLSKAQSALANIKKFKPGEQLDRLDAQVIDPLKITTTVAKYTGLLNGSAYYPTWMQEKETAESKKFAVISYVSLPYSDISDSTIKVSDAEINEYVRKHKDMFKQEAGRSISYVAFSQLPGRDDSTRTSALVSELKDAFAADSNTKAFVARNASAIEFTDEYVPKSKLPAAYADTLAKLPAGAVYGPYSDQNNFVIAKMLGTKELPDSVQAKHILIPVMDQQTGATVMPDSAAKKLADSIYNAINAGADFSALALKYSSDGSKDKGGDLGTYGYGTMVPEFNEFTFTKPVGSRGVVKTQFGYHVIEVVKQKDFKPAYKVAFLAKEITPSDATINSASLEATKASAEKNAEGLKKYAAKQGLKMTEVPGIIKENDYMVGGLQDARQLVQWAFKAKKGDISEPMQIGDQVIVASLDKIMEEGVQDAAAARSGCEAIIRNRKKAEILIKKIPANSTIEAIATAVNKPVQQAGGDSSITFSSQIINGIGVEPKLIGAAFNKDYQAKVSPPIEGTSAVYVVKVNSVLSKPADTPDMIATQASTRKSALRNQLNSWYEGLRKGADIKDNRSKYY